MPDQQTLIMAAAYFRTSTAQESIDRQRQAVTAYAKAHGYVIVQEYADSGSNTTQRDAMLRNAQAGAFKAILVDDKSRLGWTEPTAIAFVKDVQIVTVEGD